MKRLILADVKSINYNGRSGGHYFSLAKDYLKLYGDKAKVEIAGGPVYKTEFKEEQLFELPYDCIPSEPKWKQLLKALMNCRYLFRNTTKDDIIVMQHASVATFMIGIVLFATLRNNIYVITYDTNAIDSCFKKFVYKFAKKHIKGLLTSNVDVAKVYDRPYCIVPDYIFTGDINKLPNITYKDKQYDFVMVGTIWPDKGVLEAARRLANTKYKVLIAGSVAFDWLEEEIKTVCNEAKNIELKLGFVSNDDYNKYLYESKYCLLNYQGTYAVRSSGVVLDALFHGIPVAGHKCHANRLVEDLYLGYVYDDIEKFNPSDIIDESVYSTYKTKVLNFLRENYKYRVMVVKFLGL